jgi:hypothetical protein
MVGRRVSGVHCAPYYIVSSFSSRCRQRLFNKCWLVGWLGELTALVPHSSAQQCRYVGPESRVAASCVCELAGL